MMNRITIQAMIWTLVICGTVIIIAVLLMGQQALAVECQTSPGSKNYWSWRYIEPHEHRKCWYEGDHVISKSRLHWPKEKPEKPAAERPKPKPIKTDEMLPPRASKPEEPKKPEEPNEIDMQSDVTPMPDIIEDKPFGPWEERVMGAFRADAPTFRAARRKP